MTLSFDPTLLCCLVSTCTLMVPQIFIGIRMDRKLTRPVCCLGCWMFFNSCFLHSVFVRAPASQAETVSFGISLPVAGHNNDCDGACMYVCMYRGRPSWRCPWDRAFQLGQGEGPIGLVGPISQPQINQCVGHEKKSEDKNLAGPEFGVRFRLTGAWLTSEHLDHSCLKYYQPCM